MGGFLPGCIKGNVKQCRVEKLLFFGRDKREATDSAILSAGETLLLYP
jgi:hypothetical protein